MMAWKNKWRCLLKTNRNAALQNAVKINSLFIPSPILFHLLYTCDTHHSHLDYISEVIRRATKMSDVTLVLFTSTITTATNAILHAASSSLFVLAVYSIVILHTIESPLCNYLTKWLLNPAAFRRERKQKHLPDDNLWKWKQTQTCLRTTRIVG